MNAFAHRRVIADQTTMFAVLFGSILTLPVKAIRRYKSVFVLVLVLQIAFYQSDKQKRMAGLSYKPGIPAATIELKPEFFRDLVS